jgi:hypothetical protein
VLLVLAERDALTLTRAIVNAGAADSA